MDPDRWRQIEALFQAALEQPAEDRALFVQQAAVEAEIVREVQSLLARDGSAGGPIDRPAWVGATAVFENQPETDLMTGKSPGPDRAAALDLKPGNKFGERYQIISKLGEGGMGEVWKARDTRLDRDVAMNVSKGEFTARFDREARAIAAFNQSSTQPIAPLAGQLSHKPRHVFSKRPVRPFPPY